PLSPDKKKKKSTWRTAVFSLCMSVSFALLLILFGPLIYFRYFNHDVVPVKPTEAGSVLGGDFQQTATSSAMVAKKEMEKPPQEAGLPDGNWVIIPKIGVDTEIIDSKDPNAALIKGVWRVPDFGQPGATNEPMILAAHRFGYNWWWTSDYWKYHSFYLLPQ